MAQAGLRRERLTFQQRGADENGDRLGDWETGDKRWCSVDAKTKGETVLQRRLQGIGLIEAVAPRDSFTDQITTAWRLLWNGVAYNIRAVVPTADRSAYNILAEWDQSDG